MTLAQLDAMLDEPKAPSAPRVRPVDMSTWMQAVTADG